MLWVAVVVVVVIAVLLVVMVVVVVVFLAGNHGHDGGGCVADSCHMHGGRGAEERDAIDLLVWRFRMPKTI